MSEHNHTHTETCSCEHEHHHEHEHRHHEHDDSCFCGCGHEHHHEHEHHHHEHDDSCSCGCSHEHHHEHKHHHESTHASVHSTGKQTIFLLENLGCAHCAAKMEEKINELPGVTATIVFATKQLRVTAKNPDKLLPELQKICTSIESEVKVVKREEHHEHTHEDSDSQKKKDLISILIGAVLFILGLLSENIFELEWLTLLSCIVGYLILGSKILLLAAKNISHGQIFDENFLMCLATIGAFAIGDYPEAVGIMLFYRIGDFFEEAAVERSRSQIMDAVDMRPETVNLISAGNDIQVIPAEDAQIGDIVLIRPGDRIPLDGIVIEGESRLDTSPITGEPVPVAVYPGKSITSGCVNTSGQLKMRVEKVLSESMVSRILDSVENAAASKPKIDRFITRFAKIYTPVVVFAAVAIAIIPSILTGNWHYWIYTAISFLVMSCPCALVLSVPLAFFSGIGAGSKEGILFKGGASMEALSQIKAAVMDKTGTITEGNFVLQNIATTSSYTADEILRVAAGCEQHSTHPIANSIVSAAKEKNLQIPEVTSMVEIAGHGISAVIEGKSVFCGNKKLMLEKNISVEHIHIPADSAEVYVAIDGVCVGHMTISDTIKTDAKEAISQLKKQGLHTVLLTGDAENAALAIAKETGIDDVHAKLLPQDKLEILQKVRADHGAALFVGDGINDAPVLAGADVGAAMGSGADAAIEAADVVFMKSNVSAIPKAIAIAKSAQRIAWQNVVFALVIKLIVMILGLVGFANMWMAVFADTGVAMICVLNSIRVLYKKHNN